MKRHLFLVAVVLMLIGSAAVFADEAVLIDFSLLAADIIQNPAGEGFRENRATMMNFADMAGSGYTAEQKAQMAVSLALENWDVVLASSSRSNDNQSLSYVRPAPVNESGPAYAANSSVMGVRVRFPLGSFNSWARIQPPFQIPAFEPLATVGDDGTIEPTEGSTATGLTRFEGAVDEESSLLTAFGIVKNVGVLKSVAVRVRGLNFPHGLHAVLIDQDGNENVVFMGYLSFDGWRTLRWDNPQYINDVRNRELRVIPLYPRSNPFVRFGGFLITRDAANEGGDFVAYFKDVKILYDKAVLDPVRDIDDESIWGIINDRETDRQRVEGERFGAAQVLRHLEAQKQEPRTGEEWTTEE
ncbi:MAG: flagellar protein [Spirochaetes bacterium GWD1_61_31]|nr:MAG: flagellar protein [Spirochaetes bacterium GWB1_60_80]OHD30105.1 MAG: flagellar protein [Spirochaetes bacterium GWC1_61_12]OHD34644.1 MAG: flagellar protein [Spirochaetes bacterium GWD1_61_31]OHD46460.1 MAG: flagellar protein [Spirochaetes bacterium GWE1_60_18]OHD59515.1 MAG: flagellar protein [Spirochaetes bacterium GWF1_60_12]HAW85788.1 flagellar protein [Spirochaetaceae bacterium]